MCDGEDRILEMLCQKAAEGRKNTSDASWHDCSAVGISFVELAWLQSEIAEMKAGADYPCQIPVTSNDDWPDWEASRIGSAGRIVVEVSELVRGSRLTPGVWPEYWIRE